MAVAIHTNRQKQTVPQFLNRLSMRRIKTDCWAEDFELWPFEDLPDYLNLPDNTNGFMAVL